MAALGHWTTENRMRSTEGVLHLANQKVDAFFVDLHKTEKSTFHRRQCMTIMLFRNSFSIGSPKARHQIRHLPVNDTSITPSSATLRCFSCATEKNSNRASPRHSFSWVPASIPLTREAVRLVSFGSSKLHCRHGSYG